MLPTAFTIVYVGSNGFPRVDKMILQRHTHFLRLLVIQGKGFICLQHVRAMFLFEGLAQEVAFHLNVVLQGLLTFSKVAQVRVGKLSLLFPHVAIAHGNACKRGNRRECPNI